MNAVIKIRGISDAELRKRGWSDGAIKRMAKPQKKAPATRESIRDVACAVFMGTATKKQVKRWERYTVLISLKRKKKPF